MLDCSSARVFIVTTRAHLLVVLEHDHEHEKRARLRALSTRAPARFLECSRFSSCSNARAHEYEHSGTSTRIVHLFVEIYNERFDIHVIKIISKRSSCSRASWILHEKRNNKYNERFDIHVNKQTVFMFPCTLDTA